MIPRKFPHFYLLTLALLSLSAISACTLTSLGTVQKNSSMGTPPRRNPAYIFSSKHGTKFINEEGWEIPGLLESKKIAIYHPQIQIGSGNYVDMDLIEYRPASQIVTEEPFRSLSEIPDSTVRSFGQINIYDIREYQINGHKFCYRVQANRMFINKETGISSQAGALFFFSYYDEDGDGKFESLELDESGLSDPPNIPQWVWQKG